MAMMMMKIMAMMALHLKLCFAPPSPLRWPQDAAEEFFDWQLMMSWMSHIRVWTEVYNTYINVAAYATLKCWSSFVWADRIFIFPFFDVSAIQRFITILEYCNIKQWVQILNGNKSIFYQENDTYRRKMKRLIQGGPKKNCSVIAWDLSHF